MTDEGFHPGWFTGSAHGDLTSPPASIGPWSTTNNGWEPTGDPAPYPPAGHRTTRRIPAAPMPRRLRRGVRFVAAAGVMLRLGSATSRSPWSVTISLDLAIVVFVGFFAALRVRRARHRGGDVLAGPASWFARYGYLSGFVALFVVSSLVGRTITSSLTPGRPAISGAPGYTTYGGPHGKPLAEGQPWGSTCQPLVIQVGDDVPDDFYTQIVQTIYQARSVGVDITPETRDFRWYPGVLYPPGQNNSAVRLITLSANSGTPPTLSNGHLERIGFGWDAAVSSDGSHEHLTDMEGVLWLSQLEGHPDRVRIATRQFIAFTQGVGGSTVHGSGISRGTVVDDFSPADLHAMALMSGCEYSAAPTAPTTSSS